MGSSFHQVIPTRIKVFSRCKNTENGISCGCLQWAEHDPGEKRSPGSRKHCHLQASCYIILLSYKAIYKLWVLSCIFRIWDVLTPLICEQCKIQVTHTTCSKARGLGGWDFWVGGKKMERDATSFPLAIFDHHSCDLKTTSLFCRVLPLLQGQYSTG